LDGQRHLAIGHPDWRHRIPVHVPREEVVRIEPGKVMCDSLRCGWRGQQSQTLSAPHPFISDEIICACPKCRDIGTIRTVCDEPGCWEFTSCGFPTKDGYRMTCHKHHGEHLKKS
jgi:hypothetical protein